MSTEFSSKQSMEKEPWLSVSLSWILPGAGHFYIRSYFWGTVLVILTCLFSIGFFYSLISISCSFYVSLAIRICSVAILPVVSCIIVFKLAKKVNSTEFESVRKQDKDPWLAFFLSLILPGLGHAYLRKIGFFLLFFCVFLIIHISKMHLIYKAAFLIFLRVLTSIHSYDSAIGNLCRKRRVVIIFACFVILFRCWTGIFAPLLIKAYLLSYTTYPVGISMSPTIQKDKVIVNKIAYIYKTPKPGDIIAFKVPDIIKKLKPPNLRLNVLMKRVIAVGGERIEFKNNKIYVNKKERCFDFLQDYEHTNSSEYSDSYFVFGLNGPYYVPEDCYFVIGDNMDHSVDSRFFGAIHKDNITGKVLKVYWPPPRIRILH